jgi:hypothetical protein
VTATTFIEKENGHENGHVHSHRQQQTLVSIRKKSIIERETKSFKPGTSTESMDWVDGCFSKHTATTTTSNTFKSNNRPPTGIVITIIVKTDDTPQVQQDNLRRLCKSIPTQIEYFLQPQQLDMLLLVEDEDEEEEKQQQQHGSSSTAKFIISCLQLQHEDGHNSTSSTIKTWKNIDGSISSATPYHFTPNRAKAHDGNEGDDSYKPTIYIGTTKLQYPLYIQKDPSILKRPITPKSCEAPKKYIQATRWYTREMLQLGILQDYDYFIKLDTDILFVDTIPFQILNDMKRKDSYFGHTAEYHPKGSKTCATGIRNAVLNFTQSVKQTSKQWKGAQCTMSPELEWDVDWYYTNFIVGWVPFWTSDWVLQFSSFLNEFPHGFFSYRWTDQIFWHQAMGLFVKDYAERVVDYTTLRCMPDPNCWFSSHNFKEYGQDAWHRCDNNGYFLHTKDYQISRKNRKNTKPLSSTVVWNHSTSNEQLYVSTYQKDCSSPKRHKQIS